MRKYLSLIFLISATPAFAEDRLQATIYKSPESSVSPSFKRSQIGTAQIPGAASVINESEWKNTRATTLKDILDYSPGVSIQNRNAAEAGRLSIRGSGLSRTFQGRGILLMQDGIPINTADGSFDFQSIDPWLTQYVQIYRGANAAGFGSSNLGGAINLVTPTGYTAKPFEIRTEIGSFGERHESLSSGKQSGDFDYFAAISDFYEGGFRRQNEQNSQRFSGNLGWKINPNLETRLYLQHTDSDAEIPGTLTKSQLFNDPRKANPPNLNGRFSRNLEITRIADKTSWNRGSQHFNSTVYYMHRDLDNPATTYIKSGANDFGIRNDYDLDIGADKFTIGSNIYYEYGTENRFVNRGGQTGSRIVTRDQQASNIELFTQYDHELTKDLHAIATAQVANAGRRIEQSYPAKNNYDINYTAFSPRFGLLYNDSPNLQYFTNISRSFEPPTLNELSGGNAPGFTRLKKQSATTGEIGTRGNSHNIKWDAAYYYSKLDNELVTYQFGAGATQTINADKTTHQGIEIGGDAALAKSMLQSEDALNLKLAYTFSYFKLDSDPRYGSNFIPGAPEHYLRSELTYHHPSGISFGPNVEYVPKAYPIDMANTTYTKPYAIYGASAAYKPEAENYSFYIEGRNLADKKYIATTGAIPNANGNDVSQFYPGEGRAVYAGLRFSL